MRRRLVGIIAILIGTVLLFNIIVDVGARVFYFGFLRNRPEQVEQTTPIPETSNTSVEEDAQGAEIFAQQCASCHGDEGQGGFGPTLAENGDLEGARFVIGRILGGKNGMPAFGNELSDEEVAAVASYVRSSWGNDFGSVSAGDVAGQR